MYFLSKIWNGSVLVFWVKGRKCFKPTYAQIFYFILFFYFYFLLFRAASVAYGGPQARG